MQYQISGDWRRGDESKHALEHAPTSTPGIFALRSTEDPANVLFTTENQVRQALSSITQQQ